MTELKAGESIPELRITPDKYLTVRYAGASGDFNPIHIDEEFARAVGLPGRILHGLWTMAQVARAQTEAAGGPVHLRAAVGPVPRHGCARAGGASSRGTVRELRRRPGDRRHGSPNRTASRSSATPRPSWSFRRDPVGAPAAPPTIRPCSPPARSESWSKVVEDYLHTGQPVSSRVARRRPRPRLRALDGTQRTGPARGGSACSTTRTSRRAASRRMPGSVTSSTGCSSPGEPLRAPPAPRADGDPPRGRRGDALRSARPSRR